MASKGGYSGRSAGGQFDSSFTNQSFGFGVGNFEFLDSENSRVERYWRAVEFGTDALVGRFIGGAWGSQPGEPGARHGQSLTQFGGGAAQQFIPYSHRMDFEGAIRSARAARKLLREQEVRNPLTTGYIMRPIPAMDSYGKAFKAFKPVEKEKELLGRVFKDVMLNATGQGRRIDTSKVSLGSQPDFIAVGVLTPTTVQLIADNFSKAFSQLRELNKAMAEELAKAVQEEEIGSILRPGVSTKKLQGAILDPRNRFPT